MIVMESTANGTGNFFHTEYKAAADPDVPSQFEALFISWFQIEQYSLPFPDSKALRKFALRLWLNRENDSVSNSREESGRYLWWLWQKGASLEAINWYVQERSGKNSHSIMAAEFPTDDVEAFVHSGTMVFDKYNVERFYPACRPPRFVGECYADADEGRKHCQMSDSAKMAKARFGCGRSRRLMMRWRSPTATSRWSMSEAAPQRPTTPLSLSLTA